ncbi:ABC transporter ATP-binding protein [Leuconostoc fallax]|uniref:ABC transporter domain-containing protein n=1 Tax=Leuconostoc fallax TaxID=1251 RepID=A0A4R5N9P8_9LACO|nr:ABC transporter ATP-binding protein [Leuconostoc fallax]MBU7456168.1 ABC transporter ATP-binding protein [Leuconostoc fallax]MCO6184155.1 ABC transporter ATP-binding protein [Leuconostoc fallax]TDG68439.1 hypothetical protein C5L23_000041 [Leuconostoc fallax]
MTLTIANISKKLNKKPVIENASFQINEGEIVGLVGRNGAGKTTLFRIISGEILPDFGSVGLDDQDYHRMVALHDQLFYVDMPNNWMTNFNSQQVKRIVQASYENFDTSWYDQQITRFKLDGRQKLKQYSKGMRALFTLIVSFASNAQYVLLDEPLDGLDVLVRDEVKRLIVERVTNQNTSVLIASHNLVELDTLTDRILLLKNGTIIRSFEVDGEQDIKKYQVAYRSETLPAFLSERGMVIAHTGHVATVIFDHFDEALAIKLAGPTFQFIEELPINSEDIFRASFSKDGYAWERETEIGK